MTDGVITTGSTPTLRLKARKNGVPWDLDTPVAADVAVYLTDPAGNEFGPFTASVTSADAGVADYEVPDTRLDQVGVWHAQFEVTQGTVVFPTEPLPFYVGEGR